MKYLSTGYANLVFYGSDLDLNKFSELLKLTPSRCGEKGNKGEYGSILKDTFWEYQMREGDALEELDESISNMVSIFEEKSELITEYISNKQIKIKCYIVIKSRKKEDVGACLNKNIIAFLHKFDIDIEIDVYVS